MDLRTGQAQIRVIARIVNPSSIANGMPPSRRHIAPVIAAMRASGTFPEGDGYLSTLINFGDLANGLWTTAETVNRLWKES
jgi:hypothetical protein